MVPARLDVSSVLALILLLGVGAFGCGAATTVRPDANPARAFVGVFSGREAPSWTLTAEAASEVRASIAALPSGSRPVPDAGLGYRGFEVMWEDGAQAKVYRDIVEYTQDGRTSLLHDEGRKLERWLLSEARPHLTPELYAAVASQVQAPEQ